MGEIVWSCMLGIIVLSVVIAVQVDKYKNKKKIVMADKIKVKVGDYELDFDEVNVSTYTESHYTANKIGILEVNPGRTFTIISNFPPDLRSKVEEVIKSYCNHKH